MNKFHLEPVDILVNLIVGNDPYSVVKRWALGSPYSHVFMYLGARIPMLFESNGQGVVIQALSSRYGQEMGWTSKQKKEPNWSEQELRILERSAYHSPTTIQHRLKKKGFARSTVGIVLKRKRMNFLKNLNGQSATSLAMCLGEDSHFVVRAINRELLKATRRKLNRLPQQGGNPWFIKDNNIRAFIIDNVHMIDFRKVDKYWLVDILANKIKGV